MEKENPGSFLKFQTNLLRLKHTGTQLQIFLLPLFSHLVEALHLLKKISSQSGLLLRDTHPLQGELADATARAYASLGKSYKRPGQLYMITKSI